MCGRFALVSPSSYLLKNFGLQLEFDFLPQYNIAPTENVLAVVSNQNKLSVVIFKWGFIPSWSKRKNSKPLINARSETVGELPSFRNAIRTNRCLILASGYYEWEKRGKEKFPYYFYLEGIDTFAFAGIWSRWKFDNHLVDTCAILTTSANELVLPYHDRMPIILPASTYKLWLDESTEWQEIKQILLNPFVIGLSRYRVSQKVNSALYKEKDSILRRDELNA